MRKIVLAVGVASLLTGTAMAAEPLTDQKMDKVAAGLLIVAIPPIVNPGAPFGPTPIVNPGAPFGPTPIVNPGPPFLPTPVPHP
jgi:hypothetical protein